MTYMRVPPNSLDAERSVLGGVLLENDAMNAIAGLVSVEDFYSEANGRTFEAMHALFARSQPIDHVTLREALQASGKLATVGGDEYLFALTDTLPTVANIEAHARIVREKATVRRLISACHQIAANGYGDYGNASDFLATSGATIGAALLDVVGARGPRRVSIPDAIRRFEARTHAYRDGVVTGIDTGIEMLDGWMKPMPGDLIVIGGLPGGGKTALAQQIADRAVARGIPGLAVSMEMPEEQLIDRKFAARASIAMTDLRRGAISEWHWSRIGVVAAELDAWPLYVDDTATQTITSLMSSARIAARRFGIKFMVVDYLQLMHGSRKRRGESREQEVSEISKGLKAIAMELKIPVFVLAQFNRGPEQRADGRPKKSDFRESGAIEQDADACVLIWRQKNKSTLILDKNRFGPTGDVDVEFDGARTTFKQAETQSADGEPWQHND